MSKQQDWEGSRERERSASPRRSRSPAPARDEERGRGQRAGETGANLGNNLHVSGLSTRVEERDLEEIFSKYGRLEKVQVMRDPHTKDSRGFAFVTMENVEEAEAAIAGLNTTELMGRPMNIEKARRARARTPTPGQYHGPPKRDGYGGPPPRGGGGYGRYDAPPPRDYYGGRGGYDRGYPPPPPPDRYASRYDDRYGPPPPRDPYYGGGGRDRYDDRGMYAAPMRDRYDDRRMPPRDYDMPPPPPREYRGRY
ncbi:hypothetical protein OIO90_003849 [Microbotryomycetes sp. JL221]|nr:hypothetical protein OIO90_003849 [Microbotryomycetes sp. JL221]